ncbi:lytic murein transglycosylase [[Erwinia] mediterraneensis]|uniref:lytic murein transglycosylase n=1 Tax=[Erwinia] mediterraneensis TaxID=2161819 RepID=UPI00102F9BFA|nr:lytic murein transglycosylase [[Erwinia] mediterraneensis]
MKHSALRLLFLSLLLTGCAARSHQTQAPIPAAEKPAPTTQRLSEQGRDPAQFPAYVETLRAEARAQGISDAVIREAFAQIHFVDHVIQADRNQPEQQVTLDDYLARVLSTEKIARGKTLLAQYQLPLKNIGQRYGVEPAVIVALWGVESQYGEIQGKEDIVSALATLAFEGRREAFFKKELFSALRMIQRGAIDASSMKGSWAGAMGQNQFMPGSYLTYGADGDGDGRIDIWNTPDDVFASSANYLARQGWQRGRHWGSEASLPERFDSALAGTKRAQGKTVAQWQQRGVSAPANRLAAAQTAWIVLPDAGTGRAFMVSDNFRTLLRWNRSYYFAISVGMLADAIAQ